MSSAWSRRWRELLDDTSPQGALRVGRGRAYYRSGRVTGVRLAAGLLSARVQGRRATPYRSEIHVPVLTDDDWRRVVAAIGAQARYGARLLAGQAPEGLDDDLAGMGIALFPEPGDLATSCGCDDPVQPCAHVAAVMEAAAVAMEHDPFVLLRLRGRGRARLLAELAAARRGGQVRDPGVGVEELDGDWERARGSLDVRVDAADGIPPLQALGDPPGWRGGVDAARLFGPLIQAAAAWARQLLARHAQRS